VGSGSVAWVLTRATDADSYGVKSPNSLGQGDAFFITSGNTGAGETYVCNTTGTITFGTTAITFVQVSDATLYTAGTGLTLSGTQFSITNTGVSANTYGSASSVPVIAVNAQGQATAVTDTPIAISGSAVSGDITGKSGGTTAALTAGAFLNAAGTFDGSTARTFDVNATANNTASTVVARDASGNFSAGTITATLSGSATSATTATNLAGGTANQIPYQTGAGATSFATAPSATGQVLGWNGSAFTWYTGTISGVQLGSNLNSLTAGSYLTGSSYNGSGAVTFAVDATSANTASKVVARDASGNFSAGTITATLSGNASSATTATNQSGGTVNATTGAFSGVITSTIASGTAINLAGQSDSIGYNTTAGLGTYIKGTGNTYIYGGGAFYDGSVSRTILTSGNYNSYAPTLTGGGASGTWGINITGSSGSSSSVSTATSTGIQSSFTTTINTTTPGQTTYGIAFSGSSAADNAQGITWGWSGTAAQAGIYVQSSGAYGTKMYLATTDSFATGARTAVSIDHSGNVNLNRGTFSNGSVWINNGANFNSYNENIRLFNASNGVSVIAFSASGTSGTPTTSVLGFSDRWEVRYNNDWQQRSYNGYVEAAGSFRAPIFYDSNNTGYYVDPNSVSYLYGLTLAGGSYFRPSNWIQLDSTYGLYWPNHYGAHLHANDLSTYTQIALRGSKNSYGGIYDQYSAVNGIMYDSGGNGGVYREANGRWYFYYNVGNACMGIGSSATTSGYVLQANGSFYSTSAILAAGNVTAYSDERLKKDWAALPVGFVERLAAVKSGTYTRIDSGKRQAGASAQDWQELLPEVVQEETDDARTLSLAYGNAALVSAIELAKRVVAQEARIAKLEALIEELTGAQK